MEGEGHICVPTLIIFYTIKPCAIVSLVSYVCIVPYTSKDINRYRTETVKPRSLLSCCPEASQEATLICVALLSLENWQSLL